MNAKYVILQHLGNKASLLQRQDHPTWTSTGEPIHPGEYRKIATGSLGDIREIRKSLDEGLAVPCSEISMDAEVTPARTAHIAHCANCSRKMN